MSWQRSERSRSEQRRASRGTAPSGGRPCRDCPGRAKGEGERKDPCSTSGPRGPPKLRVGQSQKFIIFPLGRGREPGEKDRKKEFEKDPAPLFGTFRARRAYTGRERADPAAGKVRGRRPGSQRGTKANFFPQKRPGGIDAGGAVLSPLSQGRPVRGPQKSAGRHCGAGRALRMRDRGSEGIDAFRRVFPYREEPPCLRKCDLIEAI